MGSITKKGYFVGNLKSIISNEQYSDILEYSKKLKGLSHKEKINWNYRVDVNYEELDETGAPHTRGMHRKFNLNQKDGSTDINFVKKAYEFKKQINESTTYITEQSFWEFQASHDGHNPQFKQFKKLSTDIVKELYPDNNYEINSFNEQGWLTLFEKEDLITPHRDGRNPGRICAILIYLNDDWKEGDGGELVVIDKQNKKIKIPPKFGTTVVLDFTLEENNLSHAVLPVNGDFKRWAYIRFPTTHK